MRNEIPRSRNTDPETSHQAELFMRDSGRLNDHQMVALAFVQNTPGMTARELQSHFDTSAVRMTTGAAVSFHKRLCEIERAGLVRRGEIRRCRIGGRQAATWYAIRS